MRRVIARVLVWIGLLVAAPAAWAQTPPPPKEPIPPVTEADREAAFPKGLQGHSMGSGVINFMVLFDQLEWQGKSNGGLGLSNRTWIGGDVNRLWLRLEGQSKKSRLGDASVEALWGHSFARWWDVVAGVRHDSPGPGRTWAAVGIQGLAPYWFEVEGTAYIGEGGRTSLRLEVEYEMLLTNRLILQPRIEANLFGKPDSARGLGSGLSSLDSGFRLRYEIRPELAPYVGVTWDRKLFGTADLARAGGEAAFRGRLTFGLRTWF